MDQIKDLLRILRRATGDLASITAPSFLLAPYSAVELANCLAERPSLFASLGQEVDAEQRAVLVLKWRLASMASELYGPEATRSKGGIKKPLNAFLGEVFRAQWSDGDATTRIVSEQVSHHPPITAAYLYDDEHGVRATAYTRIAMTFTGAVDVRQAGHLMLHMDGFDEKHLCYLPDCTIRGLLSGVLWPDVSGTYYIVSSSRFVSEITFTGASLLGGAGRKNSFRATMYHRDDPDRTPLYVAQGCWSNRFTITRVADGQVVHDWDPSLPENAPVAAQLRPLEEQDSWESRKAWKGVIEGLQTGDSGQVVAEKTKLENAQREMRAAEKRDKVEWCPLLFDSKGRDDNTFEELALANWKLQADKTKGVWKPVDPETIKSLHRPFRPGMTPMTRDFPAGAAGGSQS